MSELISGAEAKLAWANGEEVEYQNKLDSDAWLLIDDTNTLGVFSKDQFVFRLKPRTVKLEIEVPAPFEPKVGELFYYISVESDSGFDSKEYEEKYPHFDKEKTIYGAWRTEDEIKIVVEQLRKLGVLK